jgi:hypothetical protein
VQKLRLVADEVGSNDDQLDFAQARRARDADLAWLRPNFRSLFPRESLQDKGHELQGDGKCSKRARKAAIGGDDATSWPSLDRPISLLSRCLGYCPYKDRPLTQFGGYSTIIYMDDLKRLLYSFYQYGSWDKVGRPRAGYFYYSTTLSSLQELAVGKQ